MHADTMRLIDRWLGVPTCAVLTLARRIGDLLRGRHREAEPGPILFIKLAEQGSTVLAASAIQAAVSRVGREKVLFLCFEENRFILDAMDLVPPENVITIRADGLVGTVFRAARTLLDLRRRRIDAAIDLGAPLCDGIGDGVSLACRVGDPARPVAVSRGGEDRRQHPRGMGRARPADREEVESEAVLELRSESGKLLHAFAGPPRKWPKKPLALPCAKLTFRWRLLGSPSTAKKTAGEARARRLRWGYACVAYGYEPTLTPSLPLLVDAQKSLAALGAKYAAPPMHMHTGLRHVHTPPMHMYTGLRHVHPPPMHMYTGLRRRGRRRCLPTQRQEPKPRPRRRHRCSGRRWRR